MSVERSNFFDSMPIFIYFVHIWLLGEVMMFDRGRLDRICHFQSLYGEKNHFTLPQINVFAPIFLLVNLYFILTDCCTYNTVESRCVV